MAAKDPAQKPIQKNFRINQALVAVFVTSLIIILAIYFFYLTQAYYFSVDHSYIVLRAGAQQFTFLPGFGRVAIQTDFKKEDLTTDICEDLDQGNVSGFWFLRSKEGYQLWGDQLANCLKPVSQAKWLRLLRGASYNIEVLSRSVVSSEDSVVTSQPDSELGRLAKTKAQFFTPGMVQSLTTLLTDKNPNVRLNTASILHQLAETNPKSFTPQIIQSLTALLIKHDYLMHAEQVVSVLGPLAVTKPEVSRSLATLLSDSNRDTRYRTAFALEQLAKNDPESFPAEMIQSLTALLSDQDSNVRAIAVSTLGQLAQPRPEFFTLQIVQSLTALLVDKEYHVRASAVSALGELAQTRPEFFTPELVQSMTILLSDQASFVRSSTALALGQVAAIRPKYFTAPIVPRLMNLLTDGGSFVPCSAAFALSKLAQTTPEWFTPEIVQSLNTHLTDEDSGVRSNLTSTLVELAHRKPGVFTPEVVQKLIGSLNSEDAVVRSGAATILEALTQNEPEIIQSLFFLLVNQKDSNGRNGASAALFVADVKDPRQKDLIEDQLEKLARSPEPDLRAAASETLEMMTIGDLVEEARAHRDQIERIRSKLNGLKTLDESLHEEHLQFAAEITLDEIDKITVANK